jgi:hypothetical protein
MLLMCQSRLQNILDPPLQLAVRTPFITGYEKSPSVLKTVSVICASQVRRVPLRSKGMLWF